MIRNRAEVLLLGYGNPGRMDDGVGAAFSEVLESMAPVGVSVEVDYQLTVEHAAAAAEHQYVVFVDAAVVGREPFFFRRVRAGSETAFSTHSVAPEAVLGMAREFFGRMPEGYALGIRGYSFDEFGETLSEGAQRNLMAALQFFLPVLEQRSFASAAAHDETDVWNGETKCETENT